MVLSPFFVQSHLLGFQEKPLFLLQYQLNVLQKTTEDCCMVHHETNNEAELLLECLIYL